MSDSFEIQADRLEVMVEELQKAISHARIAASQFREGEVPRATAHVLAVQGHLSKSKSLVLEIAEQHSRHALV